MSSGGVFFQQKGMAKGDYEGASLLAGTHINA
jgi:hypothetical protein